MNKDVDDTSRQTTPWNRHRLTPLERQAVFEEIDKKAADVRTNMARLRELRLAKEAREVGTEISTGNNSAKQNRKSDSDRAAPANKPRDRSPPAKALGSPPVRV